MPIRPPFTNNQATKNKRKGLIIALSAVASFLFARTLIPTFSEPEVGPLISDSELRSKLDFFVPPAWVSKPFDSHMRKAANLGKKLFFDPYLSTNGQIACATCHNPALAFTDGKPKAIGTKQLPFNTPTVVNLAESSWLFWDGRADSLAMQALAPLTHPHEMGLTLSSLAAKLKAKYKDEILNLFPRKFKFHNSSELATSQLNYLSLEMAAYGLATISDFDALNTILSFASSSGVAPAHLVALASKEQLSDFSSHPDLTPEHLAEWIGHSKGSDPPRNSTEIETEEKIEVKEKREQEQKQLQGKEKQLVLGALLALEAYQRGLVSYSSPFDSFVARAKNSNTQQALSEEFGPQELTGLKLFLGRGQCVACHSGPNFTNGEFHNIGLPSNRQETDSLVSTARAQGVILLRGSSFNCKDTELQKARASAKIAHLSTSCEETDFLDSENFEIMGAHKTPSLRNLSKTSPYMHDGRFNTLEEVLAHYTDEDLRPEIGHKDETINLIELNAKEASLIIKFLESLNSEITDLSL